MTTSAPAGPGLLDGTEHGLDPRVRTVWMVAGVGPPAVLGGLLAVAAVVGGAPTAGAVLGVATAAVSALATAWVRANWRRWRWSAWDDGLELRHGVVNHAASLVPYVRIQQIDLERGPLERVLGLSHLVLRTAAATSDASLPGIPAEQADALRRLLLARSGLDDAV